MASDLSKFGVPLDGAKLGMLHPKQQYRFRVTFNNFGENQGNREMTMNVVSITRPKWTQPRLELHSYNSVAYIGGKHSWEELTLVLRDDITNAVISAVGAQQQRQINHYEQTSAVAGVNYKFSMSIDSLDGTNNEALESWDLDGCYITNISYPNADNSSSEFNLVELSISFDNATSVAGPNTNDGTVVGGNPMPNLPSPTGGTTFG